MIRVAIVDDHQLFSEGLAEALDGVPDMRVVAVASDGVEAEETLSERPCDVVLMDLEMPRQDGLETLRRLRGRVPVLIVSMHVDRQRRLDAFKAGALGYLSKSAPLNDLAAAIRAAAAGERLEWENEDERIRQLEPYRQAILDPGAESLTDRETEILGLLAQGISSTEELAERLFISQKTVKNHLASIFAKLAVADRTQAAVEAIRLGLHRQR